MRHISMTYAFVPFCHVERSETSREILHFVQDDGKRVSPIILLIK